jgi:hypothetical protein
MIATGCPPHLGSKAAPAITQEFKQRPWYSNVTCSWNGSDLILVADNEEEFNKLALVDEFSDAISSCISDGFDGDIKVVSSFPV